MTLSMGLKVTHDLRQGMSQQMQLTVRFLGLSPDELHREMREEAEGNPLLRVPDRAGGEALRRIRRLERGGAPYGLTRDGDAWERSLSGEETLAEHLLVQVMESDLHGAERRFAALVIGNLDERGWLDLSAPASRDDGAPGPPLTLADLAEEAGLDPEDAEAVLAVIQRFDPVGVGARDLAECLLVQGEAAGFGDLELTMIREHLARLERGQHAAVARAMGVDVDTVREAAADIAALDPRPARAFGADVAPARSAPEVAVRLVDGAYAVVDLSVNPYGVADAGGAADGAARRFLRRCQREAERLITAVERRRAMVLLVAAQVLRRQRAFFDEGPRALAPLRMREVAEALDVHESTVSRAVSGRTIETPRGVYELRYFFRAGVAGPDGGPVANEAAREALRALVAGEDPGAPLSDDALARALADREGIAVARRTVAKYREQLRIPSAARRRRG